MERLGLLLCVALTGLEIASAGSHAAEANAAKYAETLDSFSDESKRVATAVRESITSGTMEEGWVEVAKPDALQWFDQHCTIHLADGESRLQDASDFKMLNLVPPFPPTSLAAREWDHYVALWEFHKSAILGLAVDTNDFAERIWLAARKPEDLQPASEALATLNKAAGGQIPLRVLFQAAQQLPPRMPRPAMPRHLIPQQFRPLAPPVSVPLEEAASATLLFREPAFMLPDPQSEPAEWAKAWAILQRLEAWKLAFLQRPRIAARLADFDRAYRQRVDALFRKIEADLIADVPYEQYEVSLQELVELSPAIPLPNPLGSGIMLLQPNASYRQLLMTRPPRPDDAQNVNEPDDFQEKINKMSGQIRGIQSLARWRHSRSGGDRKTEAAAYDAIQLEDLSIGSSRLLDVWWRWYLEQQTVSAWLGVLSGASEYQAEASHLLASWNKALGPDETNGDIASTVADWANLARHRQSLDLFQMRDREVRAALANIAGGKSAGVGPLADALQRALEKAFDHGDLKTSGRLLALDAAASILPSQLHSEYRASWEGFNGAAANPSAAKQMYRDILALTTSPGCATLASHLLKPEQKHRN